MQPDLRYLLIRTYEGERRGMFGPPLWQRIVEELWQSGLPGVTVTRAEVGFDRRGHLQNIHSEYVSDNLPIVLEFVATEAETKRAIETVKQVVKHRLEAWETPQLTDLKHLEGTGSGMPESGVLKVYMKETDQVNGIPLHEALLKRLGELGVTWANVITALEGFGRDQVLRRNHNFSLTNQAPVILEAVLTPDVDAKAVTRALEPFLSKASGPAIYIAGTTLS